MAASNETIYRFYDRYKLANDVNATVFSYDNSTRVGVFGQSGDGQVVIGSDSVTMQANDAMISLSGNSSTGFFHVARGGSEYLVLDATNGIFTVGSGSSTPYVVRYVGDPVIGLDAVNKRYVDNKAPGSTFQLVGTSAIDNTAGTVAMTIVGLASSALVPQLVAPSSMAHEFQVNFMVKGTGSSLGMVSNQKYSFGARNASDGALTLGATNLRTLQYTGINTAEYNLKMTVVGSSITFDFKYGASSDYFLAVGYLFMVSL